MRKQRRQIFKEWPLYKWTGGTEMAPDGFDKTPRLSEYLNYLTKHGLRVFSVIDGGDSSWYTILTVKEVD